MTLSLPTFRKEGSRYVLAGESAARSKASTLLEKHSKTIRLLRETLGFEKDETVLAWLLEQIEMSPDIRGMVYKLLDDQESTITSSELQPRETSRTTTNQANTMRIVPNAEREQ